MVCIRQHLKKQCFPQVPRPLGELLVENYASGKSSANNAPLMQECVCVYFLFWLYFNPQVRELAAASVAYCKEAGGKPRSGNRDLVHRISKIGSSGQHAQNCERDLQFAIKSFAKALKAEVVEGFCRLWDPASNAIVVAQLSFVDPVGLASALFSRGAHVFRRCFFGQMEESQVQTYWEATAARCEWFKRSYAAEWDAHALRRMAPVSLHGDDVNNYRNTEAGNISIVSWTSDLSRGNSPFLRYFLVSLYSEYTACEHTFSDLMETGLLLIVRKLCCNCNGWGTYVNMYVFLLGARASCYRKCCFLACRSSAIPQRVTISNNRGIISYSVPC